ncbi:CoA transferase [Alphaproteobacteria bacterium]|nr:CoA transferase [Alphaproteobacteria bacterium]
MFKPLKDIKILDLTQVLAGPFGSYQLGLLGANIIKIENPNSGDWARIGGDNDELSSDLMGTSFIVQNSNKRSIRLDLKNKTGKSIFKKLVMQSDVVMENMTPGKFTKLGFSFNNLKKINSSIILCSISAYGQNGDFGSRSAYDHVIQAGSGIMSTTGTEFSGPLKVGAPYIDYATGLNAAFAVTAAIANLNKDKTAKWLDISMYDTSLMLMSSLVSTSINSNKKLKPNGNEAWSGSPSSGCFEASCGNLLALAANTQMQFQRMCQTFFGNKIEKYSKWLDLNFRTINKNLLRKEIALAVKSKTADEWEKRLNKNSVPASKVKNFQDVISENHFKQRKIWVKTKLNKSKKNFLVPSLSFKINQTNFNSLPPPPEIGENTEEILIEFGFSKTEILDFFAKKIAY